MELTMDMTIQKSIKIWMITLFVISVIQGVFLKATESGPRNLKVRPGHHSALRVTWDPPAGDTQVDGYDVNIRSISKKTRLLFGPLRVTSPDKNGQWSFGHRLPTKLKYRVKVTALSREVKGNKIGSASVVYRHEGPPSGVSIKASALNTTEARVTLTSVGLVRIEKLKVMYCDVASVKWKPLRRFPSSGNMGEKQVFVGGLVPGKRYFFLAKARVNGKVKQTVTHLEMPGLTATGRLVTIKSDASTVTSSSVSTPASPPTTTITTTSTTTTTIPTTTNTTRPQRGNMAQAGPQEPRLGRGPETVGSKSPSTAKAQVMIGPHDKHELRLSVRGITQDSAVLHWVVTQGDLGKIRQFLVTVTDSEGKKQKQQELKDNNRYLTLRSLVSGSDYVVSVQAFDETSRQLATADIPVQIPSSHLDQDLTPLTLELEASEVKAEQVRMNLLLVHGDLNVVDKYNMTVISRPDNVVFYDKTLGGVHRRSLSVKMSGFKPQASYDVTVKALNSSNVVLLTLTLNFVTPPLGVYGETVKVVTPN